MDTLPLWAQILIGISSAGFVSSIIAIISLVVSIRQKNRELEEARLQRLNDNLLKNTRPHIDTLYIPISKILSKLESQYGVYKVANSKHHAHEIRVETKETKDPTESFALLGSLFALSQSKYDAVLALTKTSQELIDYQEQMIVEGTIAYLTEDFEKRFNSFIRFLYSVNIVNHTYFLSSKKGPIDQPSVFILGTSEFENELYSEIDYIRSYIRELALGTSDTIKSPSKKTS